MGNKDDGNDNVGGDDSSIDDRDVGNKGEESNGCGNGPSTEGEDGGDKGMDGANKKAD